MSTKQLLVRVTPKEAAGVRGLAWYLGITHAKMFRDYAAMLRKALYDVGKRPPLQGPDDPGPITPKRITIRVTVSIEED